MTMPRGLPRGTPAPTLPLAEELSATRELLVVLEREYALLREHAHAALLDHVHAKEACIARLQALVAERTRLLGECGHTADAAGLDALLAKLPPRERQRLQGLWQELKATAERAREQNGLNGAVIAAARAQAERALSVLRGHDVDSGLYSHDARHQYAAASAGARPLARV